MKRQPRPYWFLYAQGGVEQPQPWQRLRDLPRAALLSADGYWAEHKHEVYVNLGTAARQIRSEW